MKRLAILTILALSACSPKPADTVDSVSAAVPAPVASSIASSAVSSVVATQSEIPEAFVGLWDATPAACGETSDMKLTITPTGLSFWESGGKAQSVKVASPDDVTVDVAMTGEGEEWSESVHLVLSDGGKTLTVSNKESSIARVRCPQT